MKLNMLSNKKHLLLLGILVLALALRLAGIWRSEPIDYHPDEWVLAKPIFQIANFGQCGTKTHYKWPGLSTIYTVGYGLRILKPIFGEYSYDSILIILRVIAAVCGTLTVFLSFVFMKMMFGYRAAILTAAIIATSTMFVAQDHYGTITTLVGAMLMAVFILCYDYYSEQSSLKQIIKKGGLIGVVCGWGIASKWTMILAVIPISVSAAIEIVEDIIRQRRLSRQNITANEVSDIPSAPKHSRKRQRLVKNKAVEKPSRKNIFPKSFNRVVWRSVYILVAMSVTFAIFAPDIFENFPKVKEGLQYEMVHHMTGHYGSINSDLMLDKLSDLYKYINKSTYYPWGLVGLIGIIYSTFKVDKRKIFLLAVLLLWTSVVLRHKVIPTRHYYVTIMIIYCFAGILLDKLMSSKYKYFSLSTLVVVCVLFVVSTLYTCVWTSPFWLEDGRIGASKWIRENAEPSSDGVTYVSRDIKHHRWLVPGFNFSKDIIANYPRTAAVGKEQYIIISERTLNKFKNYPPGIKINKDDWFPDTPPSQQELIFYKQLNDGGGKEFELVYKSKLRPEFLGLSLKAFGKREYQTLSPVSLNVRIYRVNKT